MKTFEQFLIEMPISKFQLLGQWGSGAKRAYGYNPQDRGILENPAAVDKIHRSWNNTKHNFDFYFLRSAKGVKHVEVGEVSPEWVKEKLDIEVNPSEKAITVIFTQNKGDQKIPMTAWMIAHRLGHAIKNEDVFKDHFYTEVINDFREILRDVYGIDSKYRGVVWDGEKQLRALAMAVGTMRSVRQNVLRNFYEFIYELVAQYIITGSIKFNPLPQDLITRRRVSWGRPNHETRHAKADLEDWNDWLQGIAEKYEDYLDSIFYGLIGRIFVM